jgi:hypothetical protein
MDANLVWNTWRRVLNDDVLVDLVTRTGSFGSPVHVSLNADELAVIDEYASTPLASNTNIGMYRRGLVRNALNALSYVPLSQRLLYMSMLDVESVAAEFVRANGYIDDGPNLWRNAGAFLTYLAVRSEFAGSVQQDVFALDQALVALARHLGETAVDIIWPATVAENFFYTTPSDRLSSCFVVSPAAIVLTSYNDLTTWIENPHGYDPADILDESPQHWLIYFPTAESAPTYAKLSSRSAHVFDRLSTPKSPNDLAEALGNLSADEALGVIDRLGTLGVVSLQDVTEQKTTLRL